MEFLHRITAIFISYLAEKARQIYIVALDELKSVAFREMANAVK